VFQRHGGAMHADRACAMARSPMSSCAFGCGEQNHVVWARRAPEREAKRASGPAAGKVAAIDVGSLVESRIEDICFRLFRLTVP
jgi:hypothetical protein